MTPAEIKVLVDRYIKANGEGLITAEQLNEILTKILGSIETITPIVLTEDEYERLVKSGTVREGVFYAAYDDTEEA